MSPIGNWSDRELYLQRRTPYVTTAWLDGADKPVIIGEFHFGALDRGMFHPGLKQARDLAAQRRVVSVLRTERPRPPTHHRHPLVPVRRSVDDGTGRRRDLYESRMRQTAKKK